jgi:hypothetical protein
MKEAMKYALAIAITAAAMFAYMYEPPPEGVVETANSQGSPTLEEARAGRLPEGPFTPLFGLQSKAKDTSELAALFEEWEEEHGQEFEKRRNARNDKFVQDYEAFNVRFYNPSQTICEPIETVTEGGELHVEEVCRKEYEFPRHPYYALDNESLRSLAYGDPLAAFIIAERIGDEQPEAALGLLLHAAAISGKPGPLAFAAHQTFDFYRVKREPTVADIEMHLALADVTIAMGGAEATTPLRIPDDIEIDQSRVDELSRKLKRSMAQTQMTVTGSSSLKELFDV